MFNYLGQKLSVNVAPYKMQTCFPYAKNQKRPPVRWKTKVDILCIQSCITRKYQAYVSSFVVVIHIYFIKGSDQFHKFQQTMTAEYSTWEKQPSHK